MSRLLRCVCLAACMLAMVAAGGAVRHGQRRGAAVGGAPLQPLHRPRIESEAPLADERIVFVEGAAASQADAQADLSEDPSGHSPFRVRRVSLTGDEHASLDAGHHSLFEHAAATQAEHAVNVPLKRAMPRRHVVEAVMMEVRSRQRRAADEQEVTLLQLTEAERTQEQERHEEEVAALEIRSGDVPLYQEVLKEKHLATYYGTLRIGQSLFRVLFDTGSCELWIPSEECRTPRCERHKRFPVSSAKPRFFGDTRMNIEYISGKVSGPMIISSVQVGGLTVPNQILGLAQTLDIELLDEVVWDGIVGLAYPSKSLVTKGVTPLFDNIIRQKILSNEKKGLANQFAYYIDNQQGVMTFGGVNCDFVVRQSQKQLAASPAAQQKAVAECKSSFQFVPVTRKTYWTVTLDDVSLSYPKGAVVPAGQKLSGNCGRFGCRAIVDTGTYLIYTSKFFPVPAVWSNFAHCSDTRLLPNITFHFRTGDTRRAGGGPVVSLTLEPREYVLKFENSVSKEDCVVGISPDRDAVFTLGQIWLHSYYALFDRDENRIGFSKIHRKGHEAINAKPPKLPPLI